MEQNKIKVLISSTGVSKRRLLCKLKSVEKTEQKTSPKKLSAKRRGKNGFFSAYYSLEICLTYWLLWYIFATFSIDELSIKFCFFCTLIIVIQKIGGFYKNILTLRLNAPKMDQKRKSLIKMCLIFKYCIHFPTQLPTFSQKGLSHHTLICKCLKYRRKSFTWNLNFYIALNVGVGKII